MSSHWHAASRSEDHPGFGRTRSPTEHPDRELAKQLLLILGSAATVEDIPIMARVVQESPYWDLRMYAAAALGNPALASEAKSVLKQADAQEPFYFVRDWIQAAQLRATGPTATSGG